MTKKIQITILCLTAAVFLVLGYSISHFTGRSSSSNNNSYQAGWNAAKQRVADVGFMPPLPADTQIESVSGTIQSIANNKITVKIHPLEVFGDESLDTRTIDVTNDTKIYIVEQIDPQTYVSEMNDYNKKIQAAGTSPTSAPPAPPSSLNKKDFSLSDLKVGDNIVVDAGSNIKETKEFAATEIDLNPKMDLNNNSQAASYVGTPAPKSPAPAK